MKQELTADDLKRMYKDEMERRDYLINIAHRNFDDNLDYLYELAARFELVRDGLQPWQEGYDD